MRSTLSGACGKRSTWPTGVTGLNCPGLLMMSMMSVPPKYPLSRRLG